MLAESDCALGLSMQSDVHGIAGKVRRRRRHSADDKNKKGIF